MIAAASADGHMDREEQGRIFKETQRLNLAAADKAAVKLMIGFNRRFDPNFARVREIVAAGQIGRIEQQLMGG